MSAARLLERRVLSDLETPVSAYLKLARGEPYSFLLESVEGGDQLARYSIIGMRPDLLWRVDGERAERFAPAPGADGFAVHEGAAAGFVAQSAPPLDALKSLIAQSAIDDAPADAPPMASGVFGYLGYDLARRMERLGPRPPGGLGMADAFLFRPTLIAVFDNVARDIRLFARDTGDGSGRGGALLDEASARLADPTPPAPAPALERGPAIAPASNTTRSDYLAMVERAKEHIRAGDIFQVVLSQRFSAPFDQDPFTLYRALRRSNPSPFLFHLHLGDAQIVGSSPEILVRVRDGEATIRPIAGTRPRGRTPKEDADLEAELLADPKERAEHLMLLDLGRNDVARSCEVGSVRVTEQFAIERYSRVMHIVSNVVGRLRSDVDPLGAVANGFPAGTVSGAPKIRAMEIIDALEREARGVYGGAIGYLSADGNADVCIALRTGVVKDGALSVQAGAGIVADSDPEAEYRECEQKASALFDAAAAALASRR